MATVAERLEDALWKVARSGRKVAVAELKNKERGRGTADTFLAMVLQEWRNDCAHVADLIKVMDETQALFGPGAIESLFEGRIWRKSD